MYEQEQSLSYRLWVGCHEIRERGVRQTFFLAIHSVLLALTDMLSNILASEVPKLSVFVYSQTDSRLMYKNSLVMFVALLIRLILIERGETQWTALAELPPDFSRLYSGAKQYMA